MTNTSGFSSCMMLSNLIYFLKDEFQMFFDRFDSDKDDRISIKEFVAVLSQRGFTYDQKRRSMVTIADRVDMDNLKRRIDLVGTISYWWLEFERLTKSEASSRLIFRKGNIVRVYNKSGFHKYHKEWVRIQLLGDSIIDCIYDLNWSL